MKLTKPFDSVLGKITPHDPTASNYGALFEHAALGVETTHDNAACEIDHDALAL